MKWTADLDELVEQTMAFVKSVKGESIAIERPVVQVVEAVLAESPARKSSPPEPPIKATVPAAIPEAKTAAPAIILEAPAKFAPMVWPVSERDEIKRRVADFKAHQERLQREREESYLRSMARVRPVDSGVAAPKPLES